MRVRVRGAPEPAAVAGVGVGGGLGGPRQRALPLAHARARGGPALGVAHPLAADGAPRAHARNRARARARGRALHLERHDARALAHQAHRARLEAHLAALRLHRLGHALPHLPRPQPRVVELLDQGRGVVGARDRVPHRLRERQVLDALRRPVGLDLARRDAPHLLRVGAEEVHVEPPPEAVDHPLLEAVLGLGGPHPPLQVAQHDPTRLVGPDVAQRVGQLQRVVVELAPVVDAAQPRHADELVAHHLAPHRLHLAHLGEEAMPPDVEAKPLVALRARDAPHDPVGLHHHAPARAQLPQLVRARQTRRTRTDDRYRRAQGVGRCHWNASLGYRVSATNRPQPQAAASIASLGTSRDTQPIDSGAAGGKPHEPFPADRRPALAMARRDR